MKYIFYLLTIFFIVSCATDDVNEPSPNDNLDDNNQNIDWENTIYPQETCLDFPVIAPKSDNVSKISTHWLTSGKLRIGITSKGGGVINQVELDGMKIMGDASQMFGRCGQSSIRSNGHSGVYNPTQAGFNEYLGSPCKIEENGNRLVIMPRQCSLWYGDGKFDFCEWENVGNDPYNDGILPPNLGHGSDMDGINEINLKNKQLDEVGSEFDYFGFYEDCKDKFGLEAGVIHHYYEYRYIRKPGHCISQFYDGIMQDGTKVVNSEDLVNDISVNNPVGVHKGTKDDINNNQSSWSIRNDLSLWKPDYRYVIKNKGQWEILNRYSTNGKAFIQGMSSGYRTLFIISDSKDENTGRALGFYKPSSRINLYSIIGVDKSTGKVVYEDNRTTEAETRDQPKRTESMSWMGFRDYTKGILNPNRFAGEMSEVYEAYRAEYYLIFGTPKEVKEAMFILDEKLTYNE